MEDQNYQNYQNYHDNCKKIFNIWNIKINTFLIIWSLECWAFFWME